MAIFKVKFDRILYHSLYKAISIARMLILNDAFLISKEE
jgi:hypothetical protein